MRKIAIIGLLLISAGTFSQNRSYVPKYERTEQKKVFSENLEKQIQEFISANYKKYRLSDEKIEYAKKRMFDQNSDDSKQDHIGFTALLENLKKTELRKLFFEEHPEYRINQNIFSRPANVATSIADDNGSFEDELTDDYDFKMEEFDASPTYIDCNYDTFSLTTPYVLNNCGNCHTSLMKITTTPIYDTRLSLAPAPVEIPVVHTGNKALRIHNRYQPSGSSQDATTGLSSQAAKMIKTFTATTQYVSFSFNFICQNPPQTSILCPTINLVGHHENEQPRFIARLLDKHGNILDDFCLVSDVNNTVMFHNANPASQTDPCEIPLLYTDWQCIQLSTEDILSKPEIEDREVTLEIMVSDCTLGGHYGYVYIDDIHGSSEFENCPYGDLSLNLLPLETIICPTSPIQVCGTFNAPHSLNTPFEYAELDSLTLNILNSSGFAIKTITNYQVDENEAPETSTFCFEIDPADFGINPSGNYEYEVVGDFIINGVHFLKTDRSANAGPDASFNDCETCPGVLNITTTVPASTDSTKQAAGTILASNTFSSGATGIYHAGNELVFTDGFTVANNNNLFHAYIEGCSDNYVHRLGNPDKETISDKNNEIGLIRIFNEINTFLLYPNPTTNKVTINTQNKTAKSIAITSIDGKLVYNEKITDKSFQHEINLYSLNSGIYLVTIETDADEIITSKLIKN